MFIPNSQFICKIYFVHVHLQAQATFCIAWPFCHLRRMLPKMTISSQPKFIQILILEEPNVRQVQGVPREIGKDAKKAHSPKPM